MGKASRKKKRNASEQTAPVAGPSPVGKKNTPLWQGIILSLLSVIIFFGLLEGLLALAGVKPALQSEDPFVGFVSNVPLFVQKVDQYGTKVMVTANNKRDFFNLQQFPIEKAPGTMRIFCLGGSTTYGRPYDDTTSFAGWLRKLLPEADPSRRWEVINAGGVSYASYRVAKLMQELARYKPDLFIVYTGQNEFLEKRTYGKMRQIPSLIGKTAALLAHTRTWAAMSSTLDRLGVSPHKKRQKGVQLASEVDAILDHSLGPQAYHRDDRLGDEVLLHYRISLERMADIAKAVGAGVVFVTPASNLRDCSPFKSEHTAGLDKAGKERSEALLAKARHLIRKSEWSQALDLIDKAIALDPRYAELHYRRGKCLLALGRYDEADKAFQRARDEDVCPLRALTPMQNIVTDVARAKGALLVDFKNLIGQRVLTEEGYRSPGKDYFLDHVHPTIEGNRILAVALIRTLTDAGIVHVSPAWGEETINRVAARVEAGIDKKQHVRALLNLAVVLKWAGKSEDARRLLHQVMASGIEDDMMLLDATVVAVPILEKEGDFKGAEKLLRQALQRVPGSPDMHLQYGLMYLNAPFRNWEVGGAHNLLAAVTFRNNSFAFFTFGLAMAERHRYDLAYHSIQRALEINPQNRRAKFELNRLRKYIAPEVRRTRPNRISLEKYASGGPNRVFQVKSDSGRKIRDGIWTEWYENGMLKRFVDYKDGVKHGMDIVWSPDGEVVSRARFRRGTRVSFARTDSVKTE